jgi:hypothetical protein
MINNDFEYILCAAIWYPDIPIVKGGIPNQNPRNVERGAVFCGYRHPHCMYTMVAITGLRSVETEVGEIIEGFLTSKNRFVDRLEAYKIAIESKQIEKGKYSSNTLYSEDLYLI